MPRPVVPPIPGAPGPPVNAAALRLRDFVFANDGVLVTPVQDVGFVCQSCGGQASFAGNILHGAECVYERAWDEKHPR
jgi:hypothetical protein